MDLLNSHNFKVAISFGVTMDLLNSHNFKVAIT